MSSRFFSYFGVGVMAVLMSPTSSQALGSGSSPEELPYLLRREGILKPVRLVDRQDLRDLMSDAAQRAAELDPSCAPATLSEIHLVRDQLDVIAGYEAHISCDDAPSPGLSLYYDVNRSFLAALDLAN
jgi:hypothetical protein